MNPLRWALTGQKVRALLAGSFSFCYERSLILLARRAPQVGAGVVDVIAVLGKDEVARRIEAGLAWIDAQDKA